MKMKAGLSIRLAVCLFAIALLGGCGGYANTSSGSGVQMYGTIDAGVGHESR